jgi:hypothetical protein
LVTSSTTVVTVTGAPFTYLVQTPATVSVTGAGGLNLHLIMQTTSMQEQLRLVITYAGDMFSKFRQR